MAFVSYDSYKNRIEKLARFKNFVVKFRFLIIGVLAVIIGGISALLATKGMITTDMSLSGSSFTYGDSFTPASASAFLSDVSYEYTVQGKDEWTSEKPKKVGKYSVRAVTNKVVGKGYGKPFDFEILPKQVAFVFGDEESLRYGDKPAKYDISDLIAGDRIDKNGADFTYAYHDEADDVSEWTVDVTVGAGSVKILDNSGNDTSDCYTYDTAEKTFALTRRNLLVKLQSSDETYCGAEISYKGELISPDLADGDKIAFETEITQNGSPAKLLNAGTYGVSIKENSVKITKGSEVVTRRYIIGTPVSGTFTVNKKTLSIATQSGNKTYDGTALSKEGGTPDGLIKWHKLSPVGTAPSITDVGTVLNAQTFDILDANDNPVSANYDYQNNYKYGNLTVTPCRLTITTAGDEWEYDGKAHPVKTHTVDGLAKGQQLANITYPSEYAINVSDSGKNTINYSIVWGVSGEEVDKNNYDITEIYGDIKITARPLKVVTDGDSKPYDGTRLTKETYSVIYFGDKVAQTVENGLLNGDEIIPDDLPYVINVGTKENAINFTVPDNYYIKETVNGTLEIKQAEITVTLEDIDGVAYGDTLPEPKYTISGSGIVGGNLFGGDAFTPAFKYLENGSTPASYEAGKTYDVSLDTANSKFTYGNGEPVTTPNYKITSNTSTLTVGSRAITVYLNDTTRVYGDSVVYTSGDETVKGIVSGQTVQVDADDVDFDIPSVMPDARTYDGAISCPVAAIKILSGGNEVTSNYTVTVVNATLTVSKRNITVKAKDMPGVIYGEKIEYEINEGNYANTPDLVAGETLKIGNATFGYKQNTLIPNVGKYDITPDVTQITILKADGETSSRGNYLIETEDGTLEIVKRPVSIESGTSRDLIYEGTPQFNDSYEVLLNNKNYYDVLSGHTVEVTPLTFVTDVTAAVPNRQSYDIVDESGTSVERNYEIYASMGCLIVSPRPIEVTLKTYSATYGESYAYKTGEGNYDNEPDLVSGETLEVLNVTYEFGNAQYPDVRVAAYLVTSNTFKVTKADGTDGTGNYDVKWNDGALTIIKRDITVELISYSAEYGESYAYKMGAGNYANEPDLVGTDKLEITSVEYEFGSEQYPDVNDGGYRVSQTGYTITKNGADGKGNYNVEWYPGTLTITERTITVTLNDIASVAYGEAVTYVKGGEKVENTVGVCTVDFNTANLQFNPDQESATYNYPDAGTYKVDCDGTNITVLKDGNNVSHNYNVTVIAGSLEIEKRAITVKASSYEKVYGDNFNYSASGKPNYEKITKGSLAVFDGEEETLYISVLSLEFDGYVVWPVGTYPVHPDGYTVTKADGSDSTNNYTVEFEDGTLKITQKQIEVELISSAFAYGTDGYLSETYAELYAQEIDEVEITPAEKLKLTFGFTDEEGNPVDPRNVGEYVVVITNGETDNYKIVPKSEAKLTIAHRQIHPVPYDKTEVYGAIEFNYQSGKSNYKEQYEDSYYLPAYDEGIEIFVSYDLGGQTMPSVGKYDARLTEVRVHYSDGSYVSEAFPGGADHITIENYFIIIDDTQFAEKLEITPREITVKLYDNEVYYGDTHDYVELKGGEYEDITEGSLVTYNGNTQILTITAVEYEFGFKQYPDAREEAYAVSTAECQITTVDGEIINSDNYDVTFEGTLLVKKRKITVSVTEDQEFTYFVDEVNPQFQALGFPQDLVDADNIRSFVSDWQYSIDGEEWFESVDLFLNDIHLDVGTYYVKGTYGVVSYDGGVHLDPLAQNHDVDYKVGTIKVTALETRLETKDGVFEYDGAEHEETGFKLYRLDTGDEIELTQSLIDLVPVLSSTEITNVSESGKQNVVEYDFSQTNYTVADDISYGTLTVYARKITVQSATNLDGLIYNGEEQYDEACTVTVGTLVSGHEIRVDTHTGITDVAEAVDNELTYVIVDTNDNDKVVTGNYEITDDYGLIKINPRPVTVTLNDMPDFVYGEDIVYENGGEVTDNLLTGHYVYVDPNIVSFGTENTRPNVGDYDVSANKANIKIYFNTEDGETVDVTSNYDVEVENATLTINARKITLILQDLDPIVYGTETPVPQITGTVEGDTVTGRLLYKFGDDSAYMDSDWLTGGSNRYLNAGEYLVDLDLKNYTIKYANGAPAETENYEIEGVVPAKLEVTKRQITLTLEDFERGYGQTAADSLIWEKKGNTIGWAYISDMEIDDLITIGNLAEGEGVYSLTLSVYKVGTDEIVECRNAGTYSVGLDELHIHYAAGNVQRTDNYKYDLPERATLEIIKQDLTVTLGDIPAVIYGEEVTYQGGEVAEGLLSGHSASVATGNLQFIPKGGYSYPAAGEYEVTCPTTDITVKDFGGNDVTANYAITVAAGSLTVIPRQVTVTLKDMPDFVYGEDIVYENGGEVTDNLLTGHYVYVNPAIVNFGTENTCPNVGEYDVSANKDNIKIYFDTEDGETVDVTSNYDIEVENATLTINARPITITLENATSIYGEPLGEPAITVTGLTNEDEFNPAYLYLKDGEIPDRYVAGNYDISLDEENYSFTYTNGAPSTTKNYVIESVTDDAILTVTKRQITLNLKDIERDYGEVVSGDYYGEAAPLIHWDGRGTTSGSAWGLSYIRIAFNDFIGVGGDGLAKDDTISQFNWSVFDLTTNRATTAKNAGSYGLRWNLIAFKYSDGTLQIPHAYNDYCNYEIVGSTTATLTINPKEVEVDLDNHQFTYGEEETFRENFAFTTGVDLAFNESLSLTTFVALKDGEEVEGRLNAGDYALRATETAAVIYDKDGGLITDGWKNYKLTFTGNLTVNRKAVNVELLAFAKEDGTPYYYGEGESLVYSTDKGNYANTPEFAYDEQLKIAISWLYGGEGIDAPKNAGIYNYQIDKANSTVYDKDGNEIENGIYNYDFDYEDGEVEIKPASLKLKLAERESVYGDELPFVPYEFVELPDLNGLMKYEGETIKINIVYYDWDEYANGREVEVIPFDAGSYIYSTTQYKTYDEDGNEHTVRNYVISEVWEGALYINERQITVTTKNLPNVVYGDPVVYPVAAYNHGEIGGKGLAEGQYLKITSVEYYDEDGNLIEGAPTAPGTYYIVPTGVEIYDKFGNLIDIEKNYNISYPEPPDGLTGCGTVRILPIKILLVTNSRADWIYDGEEHFDTGYTLWLLDDDGNKIRTFNLPDGETVVLGDYTVVKDACRSVDNVVELTFPNYEISQTVWGKLTVQQREITVESATNRTFIYDGKAHSDERYVITSETKLVDGHEITVSRPAKVTEVTEGEVDNKLTYAVFCGEENVTTNYKINEVNGKLEVNPRPITLKSATNLTFVYNGGDHFDEGFEQITDGDEAYPLVSGHKVKVVGSTTVRNVTPNEVANVLTYNIVDESGNDYTANYFITRVNGKLKVNPAHITIILNNYPDLIYSDTLYPDEFNNYDMDKSTPLASDEQLKVAVKYKDAAGNEVTPESVGTYKVVLDLDNCFVQVPLTTGNGFDNYVVDNPETEGEITISPRPITVTLSHLTNKDYGEAFSGYPNFNGNYESVEDGLVGTDKLRVFVRYFKGKNEITIDERTVADDYTVAIDYCAVNGVNYYRNGNDSVIESGNYIITFVNSTLTVAPRPIFVVTGSKEKEGYYDGTSISCPELERVYYKNNSGNDGIMEWDSVDNVLSYVANSANSLTNAGSVDNETKFNCISSNYKIAYTVKGTLTIKQRPVTIELKQIGNQTYGTRLTYPDGTEEANYSYAADSECELLDGEKLLVAVRFKGSDGSYNDPKNADTYSYEFDLDASTVTGSIGGAGIDNYLITCTDIKYATVNKLTVTVNLQPWDTAEYDGEYHSYDGGITTEFAYGETMELAVDYYSVIGDAKTLLVNTTPRNAGDYLAKYNEANSRIGGYAPDVNYEIIMTPEDGISFTITPKNITISMGDETRPYNGEVYEYFTENDNFTVTGAAPGETIVPAIGCYADEGLTVSATPKNAGTYYIGYENSFTVTGSNNVVENYNLLNPDVWCKLIITPREVTVTVHDRTIERPNEVIDPLADESYDDESTGGDFGFTAEDLAKLTPVYSYSYTGKDGKSSPVPVTVEEVRQTGFYKVELDFDGASSVLENYDISCVAGTLEITALQVEILPEFNGGDFIYNGGQISLEGFAFKHYHKDHRPELGFAEEDVPVFNAVDAPSYKLEFTRNGVSSYDAPVDAGEYTVKFVFEGIDPEEYKVYNDDTLTITINPRPIKVAVEYDANDYKNLTYNYNLLPKSSISVTDTDITGAEKGILDCDPDCTVDWHFFNYSLGIEVEYNYAGKYAITFSLINGNGNYEIVNPFTDDLFEVNKAPLYVTPLSKSADYEGQTLTLEANDYKIWEEYGELYGDGSVQDTLSIIGSSGVLRTSRSMPVTITKVRIMQGTLDVTSSYDVHFRYEAGSPVPVSEFTATLSFNPVKIYYTQTVLDDEHRFFDYNGKPHDLGIDKGNLQNYIQISNPEDFVGTYRLQFVPVTIISVREYQKWIQIVVFDGNNDNVTSLYDFRLNNAEESKVVVKGYDLYLNVSLSDDDLADAWAKRDDASDTTLTASTLYNGYYVLNGGYTVSGLKDGVWNEDGEIHDCEILVREEGEELVLKVIVFEDSSYGRTEKSVIYTPDVTSNLESSSITLTRIGLILSSVTTN